MTYLSKKRSNEGAFDKDLQSWIKACISNQFRPTDQDFPQTQSESEGLLPWLAYRLHETGTLESLPTTQQDELRQGLRHSSLLHLDCEGELKRLSHSAAEDGIRLLTFKGHAVARTLYPHPACRVTSDFDFLVDPLQLDGIRSWLADSEYAPTNPFAGTIWLGAQNWAREIGGVTRFHSDIHWDYTSRMYFRQRLSFDDIWDRSVEVPCGDFMLRVPCPVDNLVLACVHLAAFDPGLHVRLIWLLDIYLLMASLDDSDVAFLLERAEKAHALEACLVFGERAEELGDADALGAVLSGLRKVASKRRMRAYDRTLRWRGWDLACYWARLGVKEKVLFFGDMVRWVKGR